MAGGTGSFIDLGDWGTAWEYRCCDGPHLVEYLCCQEQEFTPECSLKADWNSLRQDAQAGLLRTGGLGQMANTSAHTWVCHFAHHCAEMRLGRTPNASAIDPYCWVYREDLHTFEAFGRGSEVGLTWDD